MKVDLEAIRARDAVVAYEPDEDQADRPDCADLRRLLGESHE